MFAHHADSFQSSHTLFSTQVWSANASNRALSNLSIQRMPKTRRGVQRHAVGSDCLPLAAELTRGGGETREKPRQKSSCNAVWVTRIYQIRFLFSSRGTRYRFNTNRVCSLARIVDCSNFSNFLVICNFCNSIFDECSFRCLNRYSILLYLL